VFGIQQQTPQDERIYINAFGVTRLSVRLAVSDEMGVEVSIA
jgi:hypothetical protein